MMRRLFSLALTLATHVGNTPTEFKVFIAGERVKWRRLVEISGATVQ